MPHRDADSGCNALNPTARAAGYSLIELIFALAVVALLTAVSVPYLMNFSRKYKTEDQAIKVIDLMAEAGQYALTRRRPVRFEIDCTNMARPVVRMIDENGAGTTDDRVMKTIPLDPLSEVRMDVAPAGVTPPNPPNYPSAVFSSNVWAVAFMRDGTVRNATGTPVSATLYFWRPLNEASSAFNVSNLTPPRPLETRAVTIFGGSGAVRYWKYNGSTFTVSQ